MGKNLKGRELGTGITQRKDGRYTARFTTVRGKRVSKYFFNLQDARQWLAEARDLDANGGNQFSSAFITMQSMFYAAFENDVVRKSPITKNVVVPEGEEKKEIDFFTVEEQKLFMQVAKDYAYYEQFAIMLLTGLRISEVVGLTWDCIDLEKKTLKVEKILEYRYQRRIDAEKSKDDSARKDGWAWGPPKTKSGKRTIKLSSKAVEILERLKDRPYLKDTTPEEFRDLVFLSKKDGLPVKNNTYDNAIRKRIDIMTAEINEDRKKNELETIEPHYLSCHDFRHTFATRYIESAKSENYAKIYKSLSQMMGHSSIKITLDLYSHLTDDTVDEIMSDFDLLMNTIM